MSEKKGVSAVIVIILSILFLIVGFLVSYIIFNDTSKCKTTDTTKTVEKTENKVNEEKKDDNTEALLNDINNVYKNAYNYINSGDLDITSDLSNNSELKTYFTDKAMNYISKNNSATNVVFFYGILGSTDQGIRPLTIVSYTDDTIIATGQLIEGASETLYDADKYPLYIIFKKEANSWKIDLFE